MITEMKNPARKLSDGDLQALQKELNIELPMPYKAFLLESNGGRPVPDMFPIAGMENNPVGRIQTFFGIDRHIEASNLSWNYDTFQGRIPANLFPIARTEGGDLICLSVSGDDTGAILLWDFYGEPEEPDYSNVYAISDDFTGFLASIHPR